MLFRSNVYGGGYSGNVIGNASVTLTGSTVTGNVYGGGYSGKVYGNASVTLTGGSVGGNVYGGGYPSSATISGSRVLTLSGNPVVSGSVGIDLTKFENTGAFG